MPQITDLTLTLPRNPLRPYMRRDVSTLEWVVWHHTAGTDNPSTPDIEPEVISPEAIARYHVRVNGWSGIGYHYLIYRDGAIYKCRPIGVIPACVDGANTKSVCLAFVGNHDVRPVSRIALASAVWLTDLLMNAYPSLRGVRGHGEFPGQNTACPGRFVLAELQAARQREGWAAA